jgi:hypothetical protein
VKNERDAAGASVRLAHELALRQRRLIVVGVLVGSVRQVDLLARHLLVRDLVEDVPDAVRSDGAGSAMTRKMRGLTRSVIALTVPPLPAASRPSNTMMTRLPSCLTQSCSTHSFSCSLRSSLAYSLPLSLGYGSSPSRCFSIGGMKRRATRAPG